MRRPNGMIPSSLRPVSDLLFSRGSSASTVRRSSVKSVPMPVSLSIAFTGRSRKRFDAPAASAISLRPIAVSWSTFLPKSGLLLSSAASSSTNCSTFLSSSLTSPVLSGTRPEASAVVIGCSASGGSSLSLVAVAVSVTGSVAIGISSHAPLTSILGRGERLSDATQEALGLYYRCNTRDRKWSANDRRKRDLTMCLNRSLTLLALDAAPDAHRMPEVCPMIAFLKSLWKDRRGNALVIAAASLPLVLGSAGLASDTIQWALWKRQLQRAADSAALAGVYSIAANDGANTGVDAAVTRDLAVNSHVGITTTKDVDSSPTVGAFTADPFAVRVELSIQKELSFSSFFLSTAPTITAAATATIVPSGQYCVVSLEDTAVTGINATGSTNLNLGCGMITNSTSLSAAVATGSSNVVASPIAAVGGIPASNNWGAGTTLQPFTVAQDDPFNNPD